MAADWQSISKAAQAELLQSLPAKWKIDAKSYDGISDVTQVPLTCGILSQRHIEITDLTVTELAGRIRSRALKATEVLEAFAGRAAIAHQLVSRSPSYPADVLTTTQVFCLTDWFYDEAFKHAKRLDEILDKGGEPVGPLHGIPVGLKVRCKLTSQFWHSPCG